MADSWDDMRRAKEDSYFAKKNKEALARLKGAGEDKPRPSPITGEPMLREVLHGVVIDRCPTSGGVWLDQGELEQLLQMNTESLKAGGGEGGGLLASFIKGLTGGNK